MDIFGQKKYETAGLLNTLPLAFVKFRIEFDDHNEPYDLTFLEVNDLLVSIAAQPKNLLIGKQLTDVSPELKSFLAERLKKNKLKLTAGSMYESEIFIESRGKWFDLHVNVEDQNHLNILLSDCTRRKTVEEELRQSEQKFKSLYEDSPLGLYRTDPEGKLITANKSLLKILGFNRIEEFNEFHSMSADSGDSLAGGPNHGNINHSSNLNGHESIWTTKDGKSIYIRQSAKIIFNNSGIPLYIEKTVEDITNRKIAELQIADLNHLYLDLGVDPEKNIHTIVKKACLILKGYCSLYNRLDEKKKSLVLSSEYNVPDDMLREDKPDGHICFEATIKRQDNIAMFEDLLQTEFVLSDSNVKKYGLRSYLGMPVIVDGNTIGSLCVVSNVPRKYTETEINILATLAKALSLEQQRHFAEQSLIGAIQEAKVANSAKSQFLANMSHEIRTPLNGIIGFTEMLSNQEMDEHKARILNMVENSGYQLLQIINDIFDYSRIETGKIKLKSEAFILKDLIEEIVSYFDTLAKSKGLLFTVNTENINLNQLIGDDFKIKQILVNVLSNAIKFTDDGSIEMIVSSVQHDDIIDVTIVVEDTGIGINSEQVEKIFDEFQQVEYYLTKKIKGTGLGLTITKKLLDLMEGKIMVESEQGKGSRFIITIPFKSANMSKVSKNKDIMNHPESEQQTETRQIKILLAEDNEANQFLIKALTKSQDWDITIVENGAKAVEQYKSGHFDIILMDVQMPVMNGYEATKIIRQIEFEKGIHTPIIALTAYAMTSDKDICIEAGMDDYISKPFKRQLFLDTISNVLDKVV